MRSSSARSRSIFFGRGNALPEIGPGQHEEQAEEDDRGAAETRGLPGDFHLDAGRGLTRWSPSHRALDLGCSATPACRAAAVRRQRLARSGPLLAGRRRPSPWAPACPNWISSPLAMTWSAVSRFPLTKVPLVLPRSRRMNISSWSSTVACRLDTSRSRSASKRRSQWGWRPIWTNGWLNSSVWPARAPLPKVKAIFTG